MTSPLPPLAEPRYHTKRDPSRETLGPAVAKLGDFIGRPRKRWQSKLNDVLLEIDPATGRLAHSLGIVGVPRQAGKTENGCVIGLHRTLIQPGARCWYTAQTGQAARDHWIQEVATPADRYLQSVAKVKYGAGDTRLVVPATDSQFRPMPPTAQYIHGKQADFLHDDEDWARSELEGRALDQAQMPATTTRYSIWPGVLILRTSTEGDGESTYWHQIVDEARANPNPSVVIADYGLREGEDPTDLDLVYRRHPAAGEGLTMETLEKMFATMPLSEFARAYGNRRTTTKMEIVTAGQLDAIETTKPLDPGPVDIGIAVGWERKDAAVVACGTIEGMPAIEVIDARPGVSWAPDFIGRLLATDHVKTITIDPKGPAASLAEELTVTHHDRILHATIDDQTIGTETLLSGVRSQSILLRADPDLRAEISGMSIRHIADRGRALSRTKGATTIPRLEAAVLALRRWSAPPEAEMPAPLIWSK